MNKEMVRNLGMVISILLAGSSHAFNIDMNRIMAGQNEDRASDEDRFYYLSSPFSQACFFTGRSYSSESLKEFMKSPIDRRDIEMCVYLREERRLPNDIGKSFPEERIAFLYEEGFPLNFEKARSWIAANLDEIYYRSSDAWAFVESLKTGNYTWLGGWDAEDFCRKLESDFLFLAKVEHFLTTTEYCSLPETSS